MAYVRICSFLLVGILMGTSVQAEEGRWTGLYGRSGISFGQGDFTLNHQHTSFAQGELLDLPTQGGLAMVGLGYRWPIDKSRLYLGVQADFYAGDLSGRQSWSNSSAYAKLDFSTRLTATVGGTISYAFGTRRQALGYLGAGVAVSQASINASAGLNQQSISKVWSGSAVGPYLELGGYYALSENWSAFGTLTKFFYEAKSGCNVAHVACGQLAVETKPLVATFGLSVKF